MNYLLSAASVVGFIYLAWLSLYALFECGIAYKLLAIMFWIVSLAAFSMLMMCRKKRIHASNTKHRCTLTQQPKR